LTEEGKRDLMTLEMAGGRHRMAAVESIKEDKEKELLKLRTERSNVDRKRVVKEEAVDNKEEELKVYDRKIRALEDDISKIGKWGVILYNEGTK
jgi:hypothetical protein